MARTKQAIGRITGKERDMAPQVAGGPVVAVSTEMEGMVKNAGNRKRTLLFGSGKVCFSTDFLVWGGMNLNCVCVCVYTNFRNIQIFRRKKSKESFFHSSVCRTSGTVNIFVFYETLLSHLIFSTFSLAKLLFFVILDKNFSLKKAGK